MATNIPTKNGMIVTAVLKPSFAPSVNVSYTLTFLNTPNNTIDTTIKGIA